MLIVKKNDYDALIASERPKLALNIIGFPFLLIGLANLCFLIFKIDVSEYNIQILPIPGSIIFLLIGAGFVFGKRFLVVNLVKRTMTTWYGIMIPFYKRSYGIDHLKYITIEKKRGRMGSGPKALTPVYAVHAANSSDQKIFIDRSRKYDDAYYIALLFAYTLKKPLKDSSSGHEITRKLAKVNELMKQRQFQQEKITSLGSSP